MKSKSFLYEVPEGWTMCCVLHTRLICSWFEISLEETVTITVEVKLKGVLAAKHSSGVVADIFTHKQRAFHPAVDAPSTETIFSDMEGVR